MSSQKLRRMARTGGWVPAGTVAAVCLVTAGAMVTLAVAGQNGIRSVELLRDPAVHYDYPWYGGALSHLGVLLLCATFAVAIFARTAGVTHPALLLAGLFSALLAIDDLFLLHEVVFRARGVPELAIFGFYAIVCGALVTAPAFRTEGRSRLALLLAGLLLAGSIILDQLHLPGRNAAALEDILKLGGYAAWSAHWMGFALDEVRRCVQPRAPGGME